ncbi:MAG TPA: hypothetical protein VFE47_26395 [Tepidisphaeraceae bacterium]|nr:hypothetical protein [Tepidisphaeraceae bacterium]
MATHLSDNLSPEALEFRGSGKLFGVGVVLAIVGVGAAFALSSSSGVTPPFRAFLFAYLIAYMTALAIALGCLGFVLLQHLTRAAWSVGIRRTAEHFAATLPVLAVLSLPILATVVAQNGYLYRWALPATVAGGRVTQATLDSAAENQMELEPVTSADKTGRADAEWRAEANPANMKLDPLDIAKRNYGLHWLNPGFFIGRVVFYFIIWSSIALWYRKLSIEQDRTGDEKLTLRMQAFSGPAVVIMVLTITFGVFDLLMSLDPHWYSTIFGIYYIADAFQCAFAIMIIAAFFLQTGGYLRRSISIEHYHDLGKFLFCFTFFYGYIAFSQYMLTWYSDIPEETEWMFRHGVSTAGVNGYSAVIKIILYCHVLIPFAALLSRYPKRRPALLLFWAFWQLVFVAVDMYWLIMPEMGSNDPNYYGPTTSNMLISACALLGFTGVMMAGFGMLAGKASLRPTRDPRLADSLVFQNI